MEKQNNRACSSHQLKKCKGFCVGKQAATLHNVRMLEGFSSLALKTWPYESPVALIEKNQQDDKEHYLVVDNWCILGSSDSLEDCTEILNRERSPHIDRDVYRYLVTAILNKTSKIKVLPLIDINNAVFGM
ncbi:MAG: hypothetical protein EOP48_05385 [Sphingobacteriales bacterium]|nr:MAG: hypothetical protein EOP48_05385 [Sphingobacteriales bacterium]